MTDRSQQRFEEATQRGPIEFPFCFYLKDVQSYAPTLFHWYETEDDLRSALENDLIVAFDTETIDPAEASKAIGEIVRNIPVGTTFTGEMERRLDEYLGKQDVWFRMEYIGSFQHLCEGSRDVEIEMRQVFRGYDDDETISEEEAARPITAPEFKSFADYVVSHGQ